MLTLEHVTKYYGRTLANDDISFRVEAGQIAILLGPNGAGKSTLIKCISGLLRYTGTITIGGFWNKTDEAKRLLAYFPETPAVYDLLTVAEHLEFIRRAYRLEDDGYGDDLLERLSWPTSGTSWGGSCPRGCSRSSPSAVGWCIGPSCSSSTSR